METCSFKWHWGWDCLVFALDLLELVLYLLFSSLVKCSSRMSKFYFGAKQMIQWALQPSMWYVRGLKFVCATC